jgi:hypothetical protein
LTALAITYQEEGSPMIYTIALFVVFAFVLGLYLGSWKPLA